MNEEIFERIKLNSDSKLGSDTREIGLMNETQHYLQKEALNIAEELYEHMDDKDDPKILLPFAGKINHFAQELEKWLIRCNNFNCFYIFRLF